MERRHVHSTEENGRCARTYGLPQTQRVFTVSPQAAPTTKNQRADVVLVVYVDDAILLSPSKDAISREIKSLQDAYD